MRVGTAGWSLSRDAKPLFKEEGTHLERYASRLNAVEINSSFYRDHSAKTFLKWKEMVPADFRFAVKLSKEVTHEQRLTMSKKNLESIIEPYLELGRKFGCMLVQLPPSLEFDRKVVNAFFKRVRDITSVPIVVEPRHLSWISPEVLESFQKFKVSKVIADPERVALPEDELKHFAEAGAIRYYRLHGSPVIYRSDYTQKFICEIGVEAKASKKEAWVIFDNTTLGHATRNAVTLSSEFG